MARGPLQTSKSHWTRRDLAFGEKGFCKIQNRLGKEEKNLANCWDCKSGQLVEGPDISSDEADPQPHGLPKGVFFIRGWVFVKLRGNNCIKNCTSYSFFLGKHRTKIQSILQSKKRKVNILRQNLFRAISCGEELPVLINEPKLEALKQARLLSFTSGWAGFDTRHKQLQ